MIAAHHEQKSAAEIAFALGAAKKSGDGFICKCPAHDDHTASLSVKLTRDGKLLWKCHAGCPQDAVFDALKKRGFLDDPQPRPVHSGPARIVKTYDYRNEEGKLLFQVCRFEPKKFAQRVPDPAQKDGWKWGLNGVKTVLYRLPEVVAASTVYVVEGEKDADTLVELGLCATTSPMGADKWRAWYSESLRGKDVVVLPDNDEPGRQHAANLTASCLATGVRSIKVIHLSGLDEKGDVTDWVKAGGTREELEALVEKTEPMAALDLERTPNWKDLLHRTEEGIARSTQRNALVALRYAPELAGLIQYNSFAMRLETKGVAGSLKSGTWRRWTDTDEIALSVWMQENGMVSINPSTVSDAVVFYATNWQNVHPPRLYLKSLVWKGDKLLDTWAIDYLGAEDTPFVRAVSRRWMISAVARVMEPGCKADAMLVLEGAQGIGKSSVLAALGGEWFSDQLGGEIGSRDAKAGLVGKWIIEHSELAHLNRSAVERMKAFFTEQVDQYRPAYGRNEVEVPRQCVFAGTTNTSDYLRDETGNRRFWPVACKGPCLPDKVKEVRDQLWAEAVQAYRNGEVWWLQGDEIISKAKEEQAARVQDDAWDEAIINWADTARDPFTVQEIITDALKKAVGDITRADEMRVSSILRRYGYDKKRVRQNGNNLNRWSKVGTV